MEQQDEQLVRLFYGLVKQFQRYNFAHAPQMAGRHHGGHGQRRVLRILGEDDGMMQGELAEKLDIRPSSLTDLLKKMEQSEWIERRPDEADKRIVRIYLTEKGRTHLEEVKQERDNMENGLFDALNDDEKKQMAALMEKVYQDLKEKNKDVEFPHRGGGHGRFGGRPDFRGPRFHGFQGPNCPGFRGEDWD
ncbi:hypothetical protein IV38_GL000795 [Lactobacillus selangorensis]|uniref:HTH marR-type domain-containing protein n=1 Tax=Lactobacillus selangorensis TaxID=81857 RepID=A0A0R2FUU8_9LACO|nr:MarR family transcriptional regulator [Lactobacillus selangorensis]KRN28596.1 hypothetical protein IV38_GL000795 [Lactobacillus selangorensis]KRN32994.1 hypothetical protein IV40_GL001058 [Lactobacillus selangorensis]